MAYTIYKHTAPNGKVYIGVTSVKPEQRWGKDGIGYQGQAFYYAIQKYGWDNFEHEIIAENISAEYVECFEKALIAMYDSTNHNKGYNISQGGFGVVNGAFYYLAVLDDYGLSSQDLFRLVYLSTYISKDNILTYQNGNTVRKSHLKKILGLNDETVRAFYNLMIKQGFIEHIDNCFKINPLFATKNISDERRYVKVFINPTQTVYKKCKASEHKLMGYIYKMLPYLNVHYNIYCLNPYEECIDDINQINLTEFGDRIGRNITNMIRIKDKICQKTFDIITQEQYAIIIDKRKLIINPEFICDPEVKINNDAFLKSV